MIAPLPTKLEALRRDSLPPAVVLGLQQNGLGVARALARRRVPVIAIDGDADSSYAATRYCRQVFCSDFYGPGLMDTLCELGEQLRPKWGRAVLIPTMDHSVLLVSQHRDRIEPWYRHFLPRDATIQQLMNKATIKDYAAAQGYHTPKTFVINQPHQLEACLDAIQMPCILKPQVKTSGFMRYRTGKFSGKAFFLNTTDKLRETYTHLAGGEPRVVVQEWIPGPDTNLIFCLYYFSEQCQPLASFTGRKIRQFIPYCGTACAAEPFSDPHARREGIRFFQNAGYRGLAAIEFKIDQRDGSYHLIEPTVGRSEHLCALAAANGVNLPLTAYCDLLGLEPPATQPGPGLFGRKRARVIYVDGRRDRRAFRYYRDAGELTRRQWQRSIAGPKQRALLAWDDPGPALHALAAPLLRKGKKFVRKTLGKIFGDGNGQSTVPAPVCGPTAGEGER